jgi:hypothetical protein
LIDGFFVQKAEASLRQLLQDRTVLAALSDQQQGQRSTWSWQDVYRAVLTFFKKETEKLLAVSELVRFYPAGYVGIAVNRHTGSWDGIKASLSQKKLLLFSRIFSQPLT